MFEVLDKRGNRVQPGDTISAAFRVGNTAEIRVGKVLDYGENDNMLTLKVEWEPNGNQVYRNSFVYAQLRRFVKIGA